MLLAWEKEKDLGLSYDYVCVGGGGGDKCYGHLMDIHSRV